MQAKITRARGSNILHMILSFFLRNISVCLLYKLTLSDQAQVTLQTTIRFSVLFFKIFSRCFLPWEAQKFFTGALTHSYGSSFPQIKIPNILPTRSKSRFSRIPPIVSFIINLVIPFFLSRGHFLYRMTSMQGCEIKGRSVHRMQQENTR